MDDDLSRLCRACGMCCDGTLFGRVPLAEGELTIARKNKLEIISSETAFEQPCTALTRDEAGCSCSIYGERPRACRAFVCRLHERHRLEGGAIEPRLQVVARVRELVRWLEESGLGHADFEPGGSADDGSRARFEELGRLLEEDFARA